MLETLVEIKLVALAAYLALGVLFAVAFHAAGLHAVDAGARGAGALFRVLITPGIVALWPVLAARWRRAARGAGGPGPVHPPVAGADPQRLHRRLAIALAVLVPAAAAIGVVLRPGSPAAQSFGASVLPGPVPLPRVLRTHGGAFGELPVLVRFRGGEPGSRQLEVDVAEDLEIPSLHLYWIDGDGSAFPDGAVPLGPVWGPGTRRFEFPSDRIGRGTLVLYSAARAERVGSLALAGKGP
jgi:hypothetical protein